MTTEHFYESRVELRVQCNCAVGNKVDDLRALIRLTLHEGRRRVIVAHTVDVGERQWEGAQVLWLAVCLCVCQADFGVHSLTLEVKGFVRARDARIGRSNERAIEA